MTDRISFDTIRKYFKTGCLKRSDGLLRFVDFRIPYTKNSAKIFQLYQEKTESIQSTRMDIQTTSYEFSNSFALEMKFFLEKNLSDKILGAYTHGSLGTDELIPYSDFDGLVILNHEAFKSARDISDTAIVLRKSESIMRKMDPLQHHGWFIITEKELENYPSDYFPPKLFSHVKCLTGKNNFSIRFRAHSEEEQKKHFSAFCKHLCRNIQNHHAGSNYYDTKSLLSGFILLPAIYLQIKHPEGVFKKESFDLLRKELTAAEYQVMDDVSGIRSEWNYIPTKRYKNLLLSDNAFMYHYFHKKWSGNIPAWLATKLNQLKPEMLRFVKTLTAKTENEV